MARREVRRLRAARSRPRQESGVQLTTEAKKKILGLNAAKLYDIDPEEHGAKLRADEFGQKAATGPGPQAEGALAEAVSS